MRTWTEIEDQIDKEIEQSLIESPFIPKEYQESFKIGFVKTKLIVALIKIENMEKQNRKAL